MKKEVIELEDVEYIDIVRCKYCGYETTTNPCFDCVSFKTLHKELKHCDDNDTPRLAQLHGALFHYEKSFMQRIKDVTEGDRKKVNDAIDKALTRISENL